MDDDNKLAIFHAKAFSKFLTDSIAEGMAENSHTPIDFLQYALELYEESVLGNPDDNEPQRDGNRFFK